MKISSANLSCASIVTLLAFSAQTRAQEDLAALEEQAMKAAVAHVAPSVVRIETVGGLERIGKVLVGTGPTTGLVVSADGLIVSSAFNFAQKPNSILVRLPDGSRTPAKLVATDHQRMLVLLKVNVDEKLPVPEAVPEPEIQVGQWSVAVGRTFDGDQPNMSVGIVSALDRIWGKAVQTDAKISPATYGGPLVDIRGRVFGVLVPLSPDATDDVAGIEWYDSGIGFAVPLAHINRMLPKLSAGEDLYGGILGVSLAGRDLYSQPPTIASARPNSPAAKAGFKAGDQIVEIDGQPIERTAQMRHQLNRRYAGDTVNVVVKRGDERISRDVTLVDKLEPYQRAFLGLLPRRDPTSEPAPVVVRCVYPDSPAAKSGVQTGDAILSIDGQPLLGREALAERCAAWEPGQTIELTLRRGEEELIVKAELVAEPDTLLPELPAAREPREEPAGERPSVGSFAVKLPEFKNECLAYVPDSYDPQLAYGLVVWLHPPGGFKDDELVALWKDRCRKNDLILVAPKSADPAKWLPTEANFVRKAIDEVRGDYHIDPARVVVAGQDAGASLAYLLSFTQRDLVRGVAAVDAPPVGRVPENDPANRLGFFVASSPKSNHAAAIAAGVEQLRAAKYPVTVREQAGQPHALDETELGDLLRWIDALDKF